MKTGLGIGTYTFPWSISHGGMTQAALIEKAASMGAEIVQFCENLPLRQEDMAMMRELGIRAEVGTRGLARESLADRITFAASVGSPFLRVVIDSHGDEPSPEEALRRLVPITALAADAGIKIAIENHDRFRAVDLAAIVEGLGTDRAAICLDTANSLGSLEGTLEVARVLAPYTVCLHVKDVRARRLSHQLGFIVEGTAAGEGSVDVPELYRILDSAGATYSVILELWPALVEEPPIEIEHAMADRGFAYLKSLG